MKLFFKRLLYKLKFSDDEIIRTARLILEKRFDKQVIQYNESEVMDYLKLLLSEAKEEKFVGIFLDGDKSIISIETLYTGTVNEVNSYIRGVIWRAIELKAMNLVICHNHPNAFPIPSDQDIEYSRNLSKASYLFQITLLDHILIAGCDAISFAKEGYFKP